MASSDSLIKRLYVEGGQSLRQISARTGIPISTVRHRLVRNGVPLRTPADGVRKSGYDFGAALRGKKRPFSQEWKDNIGKGRREWGEANAKGTSQKSSGYIEFTRGPNKGRSEHVIKMEEMVGRRLREGECVHHIDGVRSNNDIHNLAFMTRAAHARLHRREEQLSGKERKRVNGRFGQ